VAFSLEKHKFWFLALTGIFFLVFTGCDGGGNGGSSGFNRNNFACEWEESITTGCNGRDYKPYGPKCEIVDFEIRDDLTPQTFCELRASEADGLFCQAGSGCCISTRTRDERPVAASCPPVSEVETRFTSDCDLDCFDQCALDRFTLITDGEPGSVILDIDVIFGNGFDLCFDVCGCYPPDGL